MYNAIVKAIKLDHELAEMVRQGSKTSTWRMYDDKHLAVHDTIQLVDKVEPTNSASWQIIGTARIEQVTEKPLGAVNEADLIGHESFASTSDMLAAYRRYYGPQVTLQTPIKIIHFKLIEQQRQSIYFEDKNTTKLIEAKAYSDGGSRGNPGPSACGYVLLDMDNRIVVKNGIYLGVTTSNQAEYQGLKFVLEEALKVGVRVVHVYMDSLLVVNQMTGTFKVKNRDLWPVHDSVKQLAARFEQITFNHIPRTLNKIADSEVNKSLDEAAGRYGQLS